MKKLMFPAFLLLGAASAAGQQTITIPAGTEISVRTSDRIDSKRADTYKEYRASVEEPVVVDGVEVIPADVDAWLRVSKVENATFHKASLSTTLVALVDRNGARIQLRTASVNSTAGSHARRTGAATGIGAGAGAAIGSVGGLAGAGIGAAAGAVAGGMAGVLKSKSEGVTIPFETRFTYRLEQPVTIAGPSPTHREEAPESAARVTLQRPDQPATSSSRSSRSAAPRASSDLKLGQTVAEVEAILGKPLHIVTRDGKIIHEYQYVKVTFEDGVVTNVE